MNKFNAKKVEIDGHTFDSKLEAERYQYLLEKIRNGKIRWLELQPKFEFFINGAPVRHSDTKDGKQGRIITYKADFRYLEVVKERQGPDDDPVFDVVVEDVKGYAQDLFKLKWALCKHIYPTYVWRLVKKTKGEWVQS